MKENYELNIQPYYAFVFNKTEDGIYVNDCMGYIMEKEQALYVANEMIKYANKYENNIRLYNKEQKVKNKKIMDNFVGNRKENPQKNGYVYFIECGGRYKIGFSKNVERRLKELDKRPFNLKIICQSKLSNNAYKLEQYLHKKYEEYRIKDEWYDLTPEQVKEIILEIDEIDEV